MYKFKIVFICYLPFLLACFVLLQKFVDFGLSRKSVSIKENLNSHLNDFISGKLLLEKLKREIVNNNTTKYHNCLKKLNEADDGYGMELHASFVPTPCAKHVSTVFLIKSSLFRNSLRYAVRNTWAREIFMSGKDEYFSVRRIFLVGSASASSEVPFLKAESQIFDDILQGVFEDEYKSVPKKVMLGMKFVKYYCPWVKFVLVADDDTVVFPWILFPSLKNKSLSNNGEDFYAGFVYKDNPASRNAEGRWYLSRDEYSCDTFPPFAGGSLYALSYRTAVTLYHLGHLYRAIHLEDAFFGVMAQIARIQITQISNEKSLLCPTMLKGHVLKGAFKLVACHEADNSFWQESIWKEYCYHPIFNSDNFANSLITKYCR